MAMRHEAKLLVLIGFCAVAALAPATSQAIEPQAAAAVVNQAVQEGFDTFVGKNLTRAQARQAVDRLMQRYVDRRHWAEEILGRYWSRASIEERVNFRAALGDYIVAFWGSDLNDLPKDQKLTIIAAEVQGDRVVVRSMATVPGSAPTPVNWTIGSAADGRLVVVDMSIDGVSPVKTMHDDFTSTLRANGGRVDLLMQAMQKKIDAAVASK
jgi:phospholipid transport system substrate-binding protein